MSQAAYIDHIKNPDIMDDFVNRVSSLKEQGWKLHPDSKTHNEYTKTFVHAETGEVAVAHIEAHKLGSARTDVLTFRIR